MRLTFTDDPNPFDRGAAWKNGTALLVCGVYGVLLN